MDPTQDIYLDRLRDAIRTSEVLSIFCVRIGRSLILDWRWIGEDGPMVIVDGMVDSPRDRLLSFQRLRPEGPLPDQLVLAPWLGPVRGLAEGGVVDAMIERGRLENGEALARRVARGYDELLRLERQAMREMVRGVGMRTLWQRPEPT